MIRFISIRNCYTPAGSYPDQVVSGTVVDGISYNFVYHTRFFGRNYANYTFTSCSRKSLGEILHIIRSLPTTGQYINVNVSVYSGRICRGYCRRQSQYTHYYYESFFPNEAI